MTPKQKGILFSYLIGLLPITLFAVYAVYVKFCVEDFDLELGIVLLLCFYFQAIIGLFVSYFIALGIGGRNAAADIQKQKPLLKTSFNYSLTINTIIWTVFILLTIIFKGKHILEFYDWEMLILPIIAFIFCTAITTFTIGLLICYVIKNQINKSTNNQ